MLRNSTKSQKGIVQVRHSLVGHRLWPMRLRRLRGQHLLPRYLLTSCTPFRCFVASLLCSWTTLEVYVLVFGPCEARVQTPGGLWGLKPPQILGPRQLHSISGRGQTIKCASFSPPTFKVVSTPLRSGVSSPSMASLKPEQQACTNSQNFMNM